MSSPWDLALRLTHWAIVVCFVGSWVTVEIGYEWMDTHFYFGYAALGLVTFRLLWGVFGPPAARFANFLRGPRATWQYTVALLDRDSQLPHEASEGHSPLAGWASVILLAALGTQAVTGLFATDDILYSGPYNPAVSGGTARDITGWHHTNFTILQVLLALHLTAMVFYWVWRRLNLVGPMLFARSPGTPILRALILAALVASAVTALVYFAPEPSYDFY